MRYSNKWIETERYKLERSFAQDVFFNVGELFGVIGIVKLLTTIPLRQKLSLVENLKCGQANTAINFINDRIFANHEGSLPFELFFNDDGSFESVGFQDFDGVLNYPFTAHPKSVKDKLHFIGYSAQPNDAPMKYGALDFERSTVSSYFDIPIDVTPFVHDFGATENSALLIENSILLGVEGILEGVLFRMKRDHRLRFGLIPTHNSSVKNIEWFTASSSYATMHTLNTWEDEKSVYHATGVADRFEGDLQRQDESTQFRMAVFEIDKAEGKVTLHEMDRIILAEFPRIHPAYTGIFAQYGYAAIQTKIPGMFIGIAKYDLGNRTVTDTIYFEEGMIGGDVVPIPKSGKQGAPSDGVWLGTFIYDSSTNASEWHLYDGTTMSSVPVARLLIEGKRVPFGFHCEWISEERLQRHISMHHAKKHRASTF